LKTIQRFHPDALAGQVQSMTGVVKRDGWPAVVPKATKTVTGEVAGVIVDDEKILLTTRQS
jgi:hypothetical protein